MTLRGAQGTVSRRRAPRNPDARTPRGVTMANVKADAEPALRILLVERDPLDAADAT